MFLAKVNITLKPTVNDPQGQTVLGSLRTLGFGSIDRVRVGKCLEIVIVEEEREQAEEQVKEMCQKLLANPVIEEYHFELVDLDPRA